VLIANKEGIVQICSLYPQVHRRYIMIKAQRRGRGGWRGGGGGGGNQMHGIFYVALAPVPKSQCCLKPILGAQKRLFASNAS
jgi:hypothetical protein